MVGCPEIIRKNKNIALALALLLAATNAVSAVTISECSTLSTQNTTYYLTTDILNQTATQCLRITAHNVTLDCQGHTIQGNLTVTSTRGIYVNSVNDTVVRNCVLADWYYGLYVSSGNKGLYDTLTSLRSMQAGVRSSGGRANVFNNITVNGTSYYTGSLIGGFTLGGTGNTVSNLVVKNGDQYNVYGLVLSSSNYNTLTNITVMDNLYGGVKFSNSNYNNISYLYVNGSGQWAISFNPDGPGPLSVGNTFINVTSTNNFASGINYVPLNTVKNSTFRNNQGMDFSFYGCDIDVENVTTGAGDLSSRIFQNQTLTFKDQSIPFMVCCNCSNSSLTNVTVNNNPGVWGVAFYWSDNLNLTNVNASNNYGGIFIANTTYLTMTNVTANGNSGPGIKVTTATNATIKGTRTKGNLCTYPVMGFETLVGIYLYDVSNTTVYDTLSANNSGEGVRLEGIYDFNITNINASRNGGTGIDLYSFGGSSNSNVTIQNADVSYNYNDGIDIGYFYGSTAIAATLKNITANYNTNYGVSLTQARNCTLIGITSNNNKRGLVFGNYVQYVVAENVTTKSNSEPNIDFEAADNNIVRNFYSYGGGGGYGAVRNYQGDNNQMENGNISSASYAYMIDYNSANVNLRNVGFSGNSVDFYLWQNSVSITNFSVTNCTYNWTKVTFSGSPIELLSKQYYAANVNDTLGANVSGVTIRAYNVSGDLMDNGTTDANGRSNLMTLTDFRATSPTAIRYFSNYTVSYTRVGYQPLNATHNITVEGNIMNDPITLELLTTPDVTKPVIQFMGADPEVYRDLNCTFTARTNNNSAPLFVNVTWYLNGAPSYSQNDVAVENDNISWVYLDKGNLSGGQNWTCGVLPFDGNYAGPQVNSTTLLLYNESVSTCRMLSTANTAYELGSNVTNNTYQNSCIRINAENITIDCQGRTIIANLTYGYEATNNGAIYSNKSGTTIKNCVIKGPYSFGYGKNIILNNVSDSVILNNTLVGSHNGILLITPNNITVENNTFNNTYYACISAQSGANLQVLGNTFINSTNNYAVIYLAGMSNVTIHKNNFLAITYPALSSYGLVNANISSNNVTQPTVYSSTGYFSLTLNDSVMENNYFTGGGGYTLSGNNVLIQGGLLNGSSGITINYNSNNVTLRNIILDQTTNHAILLGNIYSADNNSRTTIDNVTVQNTNRSFYDLYVPSSNNANWTLIKDTRLDNVSISSGGSTFAVMDSRYGKISFTTRAYGRMNMTRDIVIGNNSAYVNSTITNYKKSANVTLYNIPTTFLRPGIIRDNQYLCSSNTAPNCTNFTSLNAGTVEFNVSSWSNYSIGESWFYDLTDCGILNTTGATYTLQNDVNSSGTCFNVTAANVTLDCQNHAVNFSWGGVGGFGVYSDRNRTTVQNCVVLLGNASGDYSTGVYFVDGEYGLITGNNVTIDGLGSGIQLVPNHHSTIYRNYILTLNGDSQGLYVYGSDGINVSKNRVNATYNGIAFTGVYDSRLDGNVVYNTRYGGVYLVDSSNVTLIGNNVTTANWFPYYMSSYDSSLLNHTFGPDNLADGKPLNYSYGLSNMAYNNLNFTGYGQVILAFSNNVTYDGCNFTDNGLTLISVSDSTFRNLNLTTKGMGVYALFSSNNTFRDTQITASDLFGHGLYLGYSDNNTFDNLTVQTMGSSAYPLILTNSNRNRAANTRFSTAPMWGSHGLFLRGSNQNAFENVTILAEGGSSDGVRFENTCADNTFTGLNATVSDPSAYGLHAQDGPSNAAFTDSFINAATAQDVYAETTAPETSVFTFVNVTYNKSAVSIASDAFELHVNHYLDVNVTSGGAAILGAQVNVSYANGTQAFSQSTQASGLIPTQTLQEFMQNSSGTYYSTPYAVNVTADGYLPYGNDSVNLTANMQLDVTLADAASDCVVLGVFGNVTTLSADVAGCYNITASNVTLDCASHVLAGDFVNYGVTVIGVENVTVKDCILTNHSRAVYSESSTYGLFSGLILAGNAGNYSGIYLLNSNGNVISGLNATGNTASNNSGIYLESSGGNVISDSIFEHNSVLFNGSGAIASIYGGILGITTHSNGNVIRDNLFLSNNVTTVGGNDSIAGGGIAGLYWNSSRNTFINNTFTQNIISTRDILGGGVLGAYYNLSDNTFQDSSFAGNEVRASRYLWGGGVAGLDMYASNCSFQNTYLSGNDVNLSSWIYGGGGAMGQVDYTFNNSFANTTIEYNRVAFAGRCYGGGVFGFRYSENTNVTVLRIVGNNVTALAYIHGGGVVGFHHSPGISNNTFEDVSIINNTVTSNNYLRGGGIFGTRTASGTSLLRATIQGNTYTTTSYIYGGGIVGFTRLDEAGATHGEFNVLDSVNVTNNTATTTNAITGGAAVGFFGGLNSTARNLRITGNNVASNGPMGVLGAYMTNSTVFDGIIIVDNGSNFGLTVNNSRYNRFSNISVSSTGRAAVILSNPVTADNTFEDMTVDGAKAGERDLLFTAQGINGTVLVDARMGNYSFTGAGGMLTVKAKAYGEISFLGPVNGSGSNLSADIRIGNNSVFVDSAQTGLNRSANVTFYNMASWGFVNPVILKDGEACADCVNFTSLTADTVEFNVSGWSNYSLGEGGSPPVVFLESPPDAYDNPSPVSFNCSATDEEGLANITLWANFSGSWEANETLEVSGTGNYTEFAKTLPDGSYIWNCLAVDVGGLSAFNDSDRSLSVNDSLVSGCRVIGSPGTYWLTQDIQPGVSTCINITSQDVVLHCQGRSIANESLNGTAIYSNQLNTTVRNCNISLGLGGNAVFLVAANGSSISGNSFSQQYYGVYAENSTQVAVSNNNFTGNTTYAVYLFGGGNSSVVNNRFNLAAGSATVLDTETYDLVSGNNVTASGVMGLGVYNWQSSNTNISFNIIRVTGDLANAVVLENPSYYVTVSDNNLTTGGASQSYAINLWNGPAQNTIVRNNITTTGTTYGIGIVTSYAKNNIFANNRVWTSGDHGGGIEIYDRSDNNTIFNNTFLSIGGPYSYGVYSQNCSYSNITGNTISTTNTAGRGIVIYQNAVGNVVDGNDVLTTGQSSSGMLFWTNASSNLVRNNKVKSTHATQGYGIYILTNCYNNVFQDNNVTSTNNYGYYIDTAYDNNLTRELVNASGLDGIYIANAASDRNRLMNVTAANTNAAYSDLNIATAGIDDTLIQYSNIKKYAIAGAGGRILFKTDGKAEIRFLSAVSGSGANLSRDVWLGNNSVYVNSTQTGLNKTANVTLYNMDQWTFTNPRIIRDGQYVCDSTTTPACVNFTSLTAATVAFNVTGWSNYSIGENPDIPPASYLVSPANGYLSIAATTAFNCSATDHHGLANITLWGNWTGTWAANQTTSLSGTSNNTQFSLNISDGQYLWNCQAQDTGGLSGYNQTNNTLTVNHGPLIYINSCQNLTQANTTYILTQAVTTNLTCFNITANNVTLDCQSWSNSVMFGNQTVTGTYYGVQSTNTRYIAIKNCLINRGPSTSSGRTGVYFTNVNSSLVQNVNVSKNYDGIYSTRSYNNTYYLIDSSNNNGNGIYSDQYNYYNNYTSITLNNNNNGLYVWLYFVNNSLSNITTNNNGYGFNIVGDADNNNIQDLVVNQNTQYGLYMRSSYGNTINRATIFNNSGDGVYVEGNITLKNANISESQKLDFNPVIGTNQAGCAINIDNVTVSGNSPLGFYNQSANITGGTYSELILCGTTGSNITGVTIAGSPTRKNNALLLILSKNLLIQNVNISNTYYGLYLRSTNFSTISNITVNASTNGLYLESSTYNNISDFKTTANTNGVTTAGSVYDYNTLNRIQAINNTNGISLGSYATTVLSAYVRGLNRTTDTGILVAYNNNTLWNITAENCNYGIHVTNSFSGHYNNMTKLQINNTNYPLYIEGSYNTINDFSLFNSTQAVTFYGWASGWSAVGNTLQKGQISNVSSNMLKIFGGYTDNTTISNISVSNLAGASLNISQGSNGTAITDTPLTKDYFIDNVTISIEDSQNGKIKFLSPIRGNGANFSRDIQIKNNFAYVNSSVAGLNKSANVTFYNLAGFTYPSIFRDGVPCSASVCYNLTSLKAQNVTFNVTGWSNYTLQELPPLIIVSGVAASPQTQGFNSKVNLTATVASNLGIGGVWVQVQKPTGSAANYTMSLAGSTYYYEFSGWDFGTHNFIVYANDSTGLVNSSAQLTFLLAQNVSLSVRSLKDIYGFNQTVNMSSGEDPSWIWDAPLDNTYNFSILTNKKAYNLKGVPNTPFNSSLVEANSSQYAQINASDDSKWMTGLATADGDWDTQVYLFTLSENASRISLMNFTWEGVGENQSSYPTNISFFNWSSQQWVQTSNMTFTGSTDQILSGVLTTGSLAFVNSTTNQAAVMVTTMKKNAGYTGWCYQETANSTTGCSSCGCQLGVSATTYSTNNPIDGNWSSFGTAAGAGYVYVNYTKPTGSLDSSQWQVKDGAGTFNLTLSPSCWSFNSTAIFLQASGTNNICLDKDTLIDTPNGQKTIAQLAVGDSVYSYGGASVVVSNISSIFSVGDPDRFNHSIYRINVGSSYVKATWNHPFFVDGEYVQAKDLKAGDMLMNRGGSMEAITSIEVLPHDEPVWDIEVEDTHNFYANGILVHNFIPPPPGDTTWKCYNGTSWILLRSIVSDYKVYEEAMWWNISNSPYLYVADGEGYRYLSDFLPAAKSADGEYVSYTDVSSAAVRDDVLRLKISEELNETTYLDQYHLVVYDYPVGREGDFEAWFRDGFSQENTYNWRMNPSAQVPDFVTESIVSADWQEESTQSADGNYLTMSQGYSKELSFNTPQQAPETVRKTFFVAKGYYTVGQVADCPAKNPPSSGHRSLYTDFVSLRVVSAVTAPSITYSEYAGHGATTNLGALDLSADTPVSGLILDDGVDGMIAFNAPVTLNSTFDLDYAVEIAHNSVFVSSLTYPNLNVPANITLRNVMMHSPQVYKDGQPCATCSILSWDRTTQTITFNVSSFSSYYLSDANKSIVNNTGLTNASLYIYLEVQKYSGGSWQSLGAVHNATSPSQANITQSGTNILSLEQLFSGRWNTAANGTGSGLYRIYVAGLDPTGSVLQNADGTWANSTYNFTLTLSSCEPTQNSDWAIKGSDNCSILGKSYVVNQITFVDSGYFTIENTNITCSGVVMGSGVTITRKPPYIWNVQSTIPTTTTTTTTTVTSSTTTTSTTTTTATITSMCYQESANETSGCGDLGSGSYSCSGNWDSTNDCSKTFDKLSNTYGTAQSAYVNAYVYANYSLPVGAINNSLWQIKWDTTTLNKTIPSSCWNDPLRLSYRSYDYTTWGSWFGCYNGTTWVTVQDNDNGDTFIYEEGMWWNISSSPTTTTTTSTTTTSTTTTTLFAGMCYQESANSTSDCSVCGCSDTGTYALTGWTTPETVVDGNWSSWLSSNGGYLNVNYTKPTGALNTSIWQVKDGAGTANLTLLQSCWDYYPDRIYLQGNAFRVCLDKDTMIDTPNGPKAIRQLVVGDRVYSYDGVSVIVSNVSSVFNISDPGRFNYSIYQITAGQSMLNATYNHKFYVAGEYVEAKDLKVGDILTTFDGSKKAITRIDILPYEEDVWDLSVDGTHNFFANGILVHNAGFTIWSCYHGVFDNLGTSGGQAIYEEAMWWNITS